MATNNRKFMLQFRNRQDDPTRVPKWIPMVLPDKPEFDSLEKVREYALEVMNTDSGILSVRVLTTAWGHLGIHVNPSTGETVADLTSPWSLDAQYDWSIVTSGPQTRSADLTPVTPDDPAQTRADQYRFIRPTS